MALLVAALSGGLASRAAPPHGAVGFGAVVVTVLAALPLDAFGGIVVGLAAAAVPIAARQAAGDWASDQFVDATALTLALVALGWSTGRAGASLRGQAQPRERGGDIAPAHGSLGLLPADLALPRLEEEIARARRHRRPLTVVLIATDITDPDLSERARQAGLRTVARLLESLVPETAVPFAFAPDEVAAILPETDESAAWEVLGPVVDAASHASFTVREEQDRRSLVDCAELHAALSPLTSAHPDAHALVTELRERVARERPGSAEPADRRPSS